MVFISLKIRMYHCFISLSKQYCVKNIVKRHITFYFSSLPSFVSCLIQFPPKESLFQISLFYIIQLKKKVGVQTHTQHKKVQLFTKFKLSFYIEGTTHSFKQSFFISL
jgi:hypothetical protein